MNKIELSIREALQGLDEIALDNGNRRRLTLRERAVLAAVGNLVHEVARTRPGVIDIDNGKIALAPDQTALEIDIKG